MADKAVSMAEAGCDYITVLSVDYMSDNVRAILDQAGFKKDGAALCMTFGHKVVEEIKELYSDAFLIALFEVPREMFSLAMEAKRRGIGVVGSTQNILYFIKKRVQYALDGDKVLQLSWISNSNVVDSVTLSMKHMETYMGESDGWNCGLKKDDKMALKLLRARYCHMLLTSI